MFIRLSLSLLTLASFAASAQSPSSGGIAAPNFQLPYSCGYTYSGFTDSQGTPKALIQFERNSPVTDTLRASAAGIVREVGSSDNVGGVNGTIVIDHGRGWTTTYVNAGNVKVRRNQTVQVGEALGTIGRLGHPSNAHLQYMQSRFGFPVKASFNGTSAMYFGERDYLSVNGCGNSGPVQGTVRLNARVSSTPVRITSMPRAEVLGEIANNTRVNVLCQSVGGNYLLDASDRPSPDGSELWYRIDFNGRKGHVPAPMIQLGRTAAPEICPEARG